MNMGYKKQKKYKKPELKLHGNIQKITEGTGPSGGDVNDRTFG